MPDHDVVIVGAGPVGLLLACLLAQREVDVAVCERRADADGRSRAIGIHPPGLDALHAVGLGEAVRREALALEGGEVRSRGRTLASLDFTSERPVLVLPQQRTGALLVERLSRLSAGALRTGQTVRSLRDEGDFVRVAIDGGQGLQETTADAVVVADGVHSALRAHLGLEWRRRPGEGRYAMLDVEDAGAQARAVLHCGPGGLVESFPMPGSLRRWVVRTGEGEQPLGTGAAFRDEIERRTEVRPEIPDGAVPVPFLATQHVAVAAAGRRIVLLGDAAHEISPIGGQGMNLGWTAAVHLAAELLRGLDSGAVDLRRQGRRNIRAARAAQRRSAFYMRMGMPASGLTLESRELLIRAMGTPLMRGWSAGLITMRGS